MEVIGKIKMIGEVQTFGENGFRKREAVITTDEQYPQMINVEFIQDNVDLLNNYKVGQDVRISINLKGREWINPEGEAKYFNTIQGWRIASLTKEQVNDSDVPPANVNADPTEEKDDDLPF